MGPTYMAVLSVSSLHKGCVVLVCERQSVTLILTVAACCYNGLHVEGGGQIL
jgi:hypothetical protein